MAVNPTLTFEMQLHNTAILDAEGNAILDATDEAVMDAAISWADLLADTRSSVPIRIRKGNFGGSQLDRVADVGTMSFALDNTTGNSGGKLGYYSPSHANARYGFDETAKVRVSLASAGNTRYKFQGIRLDSIDPISGQYGPRLTGCVAVDWMDEAMTAPAKGLTVQLLKRDDQLITSLLAVMDNQPEDTEVATGPDQYGAAFSDVRSESTTVAGVLQDLAQSGLGTIFLNGDDTTGEVLKYRSRHTLLGSSTPSADLDDEMMSMKAPRLSKNRIREAITVTHPVRVDAAATTELYVLQKEVVITAGDTVTFSGRYVDPNNESRRITGTSIVAPLVAGTHYKFSSSSGSGEDLNASLGVTATMNADTADFSFVNNAAVTGYLWFLKVIGKGLYPYDEVEHRSIDTDILKGQTLNFDMIYQDDFSIGRYASESLLSWESQTENERPVVQFKANRTAALMAAAILVEPGDMVQITETVTGVDRQFFVNGVELDIKHGGRDIDVYWSCVPAQTATDFCILDLIGSAELDSTAKLAF